MYDFLGDLGLVSTQSVFMAETSSTEDQIQEGRRVAEDSFNVNAEGPGVQNLVHMLESRTGGEETKHPKTSLERKASRQRCLFQIHMHQKSNKALSQVATAQVAASIARSQDTITKSFTRIQNER